MALRSIFSVPAILASMLAFTAPSLADTDNGNECSCFRTNASAYFVNHQFHDWRNVTDAAAAPSLITTELNATNAIATSSYFTSDPFKSQWTIVNWNNSDTLNTSGIDATTLMINTPNNVYIEQSTDSDTSYNSYLVLRTTRHPDFQSAAEIDSTEQNYQYVSARFMARVVGSSGACAGMFTYLSNSDPLKVQEADIEILTQGPRNMVQYTNQPSVDKNGNAVSQSTVNGTLGDKRDWSSWNVYRVDWSPKTTSWYVNGESMANISYQVPRDPAGLILNMWSDGGSWTGNMSVYDEAFLQLQWMQVVYNTSGAYAGANANNRRDDLGAFGLLEKRKSKTPGCKVVCSVDEKVNVTGTPALLYNNTGSAPAGYKGEGVGSLVWLPLLLVGGAVFGYF